MACTRGPRHRGTLTHDRAIEWRCNERSEASVDRRRRHHLCHSFASLLLHKGRSVVYVARQLGHGAQMTLGTYGHVIDELDDTPHIGTETAIAQARDGTSATQQLPKTDAGRAIT